MNDIPEIPTNVHTPQFPPLLGDSKSQTVVPAYRPCQVRRALSLGVAVGVVWLVWRGVVWCGVAHGLRWVCAGVCARVRVCARV